jgi:hypothetical protein
MTCVNECGIRQPAIAITRLEHFGADNTFAAVVVYIYLAVAANCVRQQLAEISAAGLEIQHTRTRTHIHESQHLGRPAACVARDIFRAAAGMVDHGSVGGSRTQDALIQ